MAYVINKFNKEQLVVLADGTIDIVATDHAPHSSESKDCEWSVASFGMVGLETALSIVIKTMVETGLMNYQDVAQRLSIAPAQIARYENHGQDLVIGNVANLTVVDTAANWVVDRDLMSTRSKNTPFHGFELPGVVTHTFFNGKLVFGE
jgi:dihydroorotase